MSFDITSLLDSSKITTVPKDQQKLLESHGLGGIHPWGRGPCSDDIPPAILSTVKEAYQERQKRDANRAKLMTGGRPPKTGKLDHPTAGGTTSETQTRRPDSPSLSKPASESVSHNDRQTTPDPSERSSPESSPERQIPWTPSPERGGPEHRVVENPSSGQDQRQTSHTTKSATPNMAPPPKPKAGLRSAPEFEFQPSAPEEDLEVELPQAHEMPRESTQAGATYLTQVPPAAQSSMETPDARNLRTMDTPPCAQPSQIIPGTAPSPLPRPAVENPQRRRMKRNPLHRLDEDGGPTEPAVISDSIQRTAPSTASSQPLSSNTTSSSIVPATLEPPATPTRPTSLSLPHRSPLQTTESQAGFEEEALDGTTLYAHGPSPLDRTEGSEPRVIMEQHEAATPFDAFSTHYPDYTSKYGGTVTSFIRACICLEHMRKHKGLHYMLWDDFIRAFSAEYLSYVKNTTEPLVAKEWYNDRDQDPLFLDRVIHRNNLDNVLVFYDGEVSQARKFIVSDTDAPPAPWNASRNASSAPNGSFERPVEKVGPAKSENPQRHSLGALPAINTPRLSTTQTPKSTPSSTPALRKRYIRNLSKPRSAQDQERLRQIFSRNPSSGGSGSGG